MYPINGESRYSLLYRLAFENYLLPADIVKVDSRKKASLYIDNRNYSTNSQVDKAIDEAIQCVAPDTSKLLLNQYDAILFSTKSTDYERKHVYFRTGVKFCPICLQESFHHRLVWDVTWKTACVKHQAYLVPKCPRCSRKVYPSKLMEGRCECGVEYATLPPERPSDAVLETQAIIDKLLEQNQTHVVISEKEFSSQKFFQLLYVLSRLFDGFSTSHSLFEDLDELETKEKVQFLIRNKGERDPKVIGTLATAAHRFLIDPEKYFFDIYYFMSQIKRRSGNDLQVKVRWLKRYIQSNR